MKKLPPMTVHQSTYAGGSHPRLALLSSCVPILDRGLRGSSIGGRRQPEAQVRFFCEPKAMPKSFTACAALKIQECSRLTMSSPSVCKTRRFAPVLEEHSHQHFSDQA